MRIRRDSMGKDKVLFVCVHNSARSQMAEALLREMAGDRFEVESAGLEPGELNPLAVEVMKEIGIDISGNQTKSAFDFFKEGKRFVREHHSHFWFSLQRPSSFEELNMGLVTPRGERGDPGPEFSDLGLEPFFEVEGFETEGIGFSDDWQIAR